MFRRTEIRVHGNRRDENFDYEHGEMDKSREEFGEEFEHAEYCDFIMEIARADSKTRDTRTCGNESIQ